MQEYPWFRGAAHGEDADFLFMVYYRPQTDPEIRLANAMIDAWTNFAKFGYVVGGSDIRRVGGCFASFVLPHHNCEGMLGDIRSNMKNAAI